MPIVSSPSTHHIGGQQAPLFCHGRSRVAELVVWLNTEANGMGAFLRSELTNPVWCGAMMSAENAGLVWIPGPPGMRAT